MGLLYLNGQPYTIVADADMNTGKRSLVKSSRGAQETDPKVIREATWMLGGEPFGNSRAYEGGRLGTDYTENLEHRYDNLLTSTAKRTALTLTGDDGTTSETATPNAAANNTSIGDAAWSDAANSIDGNAATAATVTLTGPGATFPDDTSVTETTFTSAATSHAVAMPATVAAGDLLICGFVNDGSSTVTTPAGWTLLGTSTFSVRLSLYAIDAVGNEDGTTVDFVTSAAQEAAAQVYRITAATWGGTLSTDVAISGASIGSSANPNSSSVTPSWGAQNTLWLSFFGQVGETTISAAPTNYGSSNETNGSGNVVTVGSAVRDLNTATEDPGQFTTSASGAWVAYTVAVEPAAAGGGSGQSSNYLRLTDLQDFAGIAGVVITGVRVSITKSGTGDRIVDHTVQLRIGGASSGSNKADTTTAWPTSAETVTYGGPTDLWGLSSITAASIDAADFGVDIACEHNEVDSSSGVASVYEVTVTAYFGAGGANLARADEQSSHAFLHRGATSSQVRLSDMTFIQSDTHNAIVKDAASWKGTGKLAMGTGDAVQERTAVTASSATYADAVSTSPTNDVMAKALGVGSDRIWIAQATGTNYTNNYASSFMDNLDVRIAEFQVVDTEIPITGVGFNGPFTLFGTEDGLYSFTESGRSVPLIPALRGLRDTRNCRWIVQLWGWTFVNTIRGIYAISGTTANPVGPERLKNFEGPIRGVCTAIWPVGESLFAAYLNEGTGDTYVLRGDFGAETEAAGIPDWFCFRFLDSLESHCIFSSASSRALTTLIVAEGTNCAWYSLGRGGREIADSEYRFSTEGGSWHGTTLMLRPGFTGYPRYFTFLTENCGASDTWSVGADVDDSGGYTSVGSSVTSDGRQVIRPVASSIPVSGFNFRRIKPRLTQTATSATEPPQIRGAMTMAYDVRCDQVTEVQAVVQLGMGEAAKTTYDRLDALTDPANQTSPITMVLPDSPDTRYGFVTKVINSRDVKGDSIQAAAVDLLLWDVS